LHRIPNRNLLYVVCLLILVEGRNETVQKLKPAKSVGPTRHVELVSMSIELEGLTSMRFGSLPAKKKIK